MLVFPLVYSDGYVVDLGDHIFPAVKYRLVRERLLQDETASSDDFVGPAPIADQDVLNVHAGDYVRKLKTGSLSVEEQLQLEVPYSPTLVEAVWLATGGTLLACERALEGGVAVNLSGGYHHAFADHGEGFCVINDVAIALRALKVKGRTSRAAIIDLDVHQGNGTAAIFADDPDVFTFSVHQQNNYPLFKPPSDLDVGLPDGAGGEQYLAVVERHVPEIIEGHRPDIIVYLAGADPYREDRLGGLALSKEDLLERDRKVFTLCRETSVPVAAVLAGGYAARTEDTVAIHVGTVVMANEVYRGGT